LIDPDRAILKFCNAGHHPAIWWKEESQLIKLLNPTGPAIGLIKNAEFTSSELHFNTGDMFVMYTDGLVEASNSDNEEFGEDRLADLVKKNRHYTADQIMKILLDEVTTFAGQFNDDVTILIIKIL